MLGSSVSGSFLFSLHALTLGNCFKYHLFTNELQFLNQASCLLCYTSTYPTAYLTSPLKISENHLKPNIYKCELKNGSCPYLVFYYFLDQQRALSIWLSQIKLSSYVWNVALLHQSTCNPLARTCHIYLQNISRIHSRLSIPTATTLVQTTAISHRALPHYVSLLVYLPIQSIYFKI